MNHTPRHMIGKSAIIQGMINKGHRSNKVHAAIMGVVTLGTLVTITLTGRPTTPDCDLPETWATASGVQHCAINGGK